MEEGKEEFRLRKIPIELLLDTLHELYDKGIDFVDISGEKGDGQDHVFIGYCKEYVDPDFKPEDMVIDFLPDEFYEVDGEEDDEEEDEVDSMLVPKKQVTVRLTDSDINDLTV